MHGHIQCQQALLRSSHIDHPQLTGQVRSTPLGAAMSDPRAPRAFQPKPTSSISLSQRGVRNP